MAKDKVVPFSWDSGIYRSFVPSSFDTKVTDLTVQHQAYLCADPMAQIAPFCKQGAWKALDASSQREVDK